LDAPLALAFRRTPQASLKKNPRMNRPIDDAYKFLRLYDLYLLARQRRRN